MTTGGDRTFLREQADSAGAVPDHAPAFGQPGLFHGPVEWPGGAPSGRHPVDKLCAEQGIEHRLIPPRQSETNALVERFNGRISEVLVSVHLRNREAMEETLERYRRLYNGQIPK